VEVRGAAGDYDLDPGGGGRLLTRPEAGCEESSDLWAVVTAGSSGRRGRRARAADAGRPSPGHRRMERRTPVDPSPRTR